ncbi:MAG TPA: hypothetical protein VJ999_04205 [Candidatus Sulfotelmatobacter sp.]|nr:hypothetical protein [Candidatus Sulfotelmatobacter sp.]
MSQKFHALIPGIVLLAATIFPLSLASAQAVSLQEQLAAQYKLVKMGSDTGGYSVVEAGTLLAIQKGGILGVPYSDQTVLATKYEGGTVHSPSSLLVQGKKSLLGHFSQTQSQGQTTHLFAVGDKVYPTKIEVNVASDKVSMGIVACDTCNKTDPPTYNKAQVVFQFPKGALANASAGQVEDVIGQLLSISSDDAQQGGGQGGNDQQGNNQQGGDQGAAQGQAQQQAPPPEPQQIEKGQTPDQVKAALGNPDKIVNLGSKQIFVYKDLKVTFINGKVSDVQ